MFLKIFHEAPSQIDKKYQSWVESQKRGVEVISFTSQTAYSMTTLTVHYKHCSKDGSCD